MRERIEALARRSGEERSLLERAADAFRRLLIPPLTVESNALVLLAEELRRAPDSPELPGLRAAAEVELGQNVALAERHADAGTPLEADRLHALAQIDALLLRLRTVDGLPGGRARAVAARVTALAFAEALPVTPPSAADASLALVDAFLDAASGETSSMRRRRGLLEAARRTLLDASARAEVDHVSEVSRRSRIGRELSLLHRAEAAGIGADVSLPFQIKSACSRGDRTRAFASASALRALSMLAGDAELAAPADRVRSACTETPVKPDSLARSQREVFGNRACDLIDAAYVAASATNEGRVMPLHPSESADALTAMLAVAGALEIGGSITPVMVREPVRIPRRVPFPTQAIRIEQATQVDEVPRAIVGDPRALLHDLASGRLLVRAFVKQERVEKEQTHYGTEGRYYLLDGSSSMLTWAGGARARVRDAILLAELATAYERFARFGDRARVSVHYRYFTDELGPARTVRTMADTEAAIADVVCAERRGNTDIALALLTCFGDIRAAAEEDPSLERVNIVLVTDGAAPVDSAAVGAAREGVAQIALHVSVIALGEENVALRDLVAQQRAEGQQAFYQYLDDAELRRMLEPDGTHVLHLPEEEAMQVRARGDVARALEAAAEALEEVSRGREGARLDEARLDEEAWRAAGLAIDFLPGPSLSGPIAREENLSGDTRALLRRFDRWFPVVDAGASSAETRSSEEAARLVLGLAEVVELVGGHGLARRSDAIELLERGLAAIGLDSLRYARLLEHPSPALAQAIGTLRAAIEGD